jgi:acyl-CoA thioester hydrolase
VTGHRARVDAVPDPRDIPGDFPHRVQVPVRLADTDAFAHVNNATYLTYFEIGRLEYLAAAERHPVPIPTLGGRRSYILAEARVTFRSQAAYGETLTLETRVGRVGRTSLTMEHRITTPHPVDPGGRARLVAVGETILVRFDYDLQGPVRFEDELVAALERFERRPLRV